MNRIGAWKMSRHERVCEVWIGFTRDRKRKRKSKHAISFGNPANFSWYMTEDEWGLGKLGFFNFS